MGWEKSPLHSRWEAGQKGARCGPRTTHCVQALYYIKYINRDCAKETCLQRMEEEICLAGSQQIIFKDDEKYFLEKMEAEVLLKFMITV